MTKSQIQRNLDKIAEIANELGVEAKRRYGKDAELFFECEGGFHIMDGDSDRSLSDRQSHIRMSSSKHCTMGTGAW